MDSLSERETTKKQKKKNTKKSTSDSTAIFSPESLLQLFLASLK